MSILLFLGVLVALIVVHEFGHFIIAKRVGARVDEFGIFFPPKIVGKKIGETEYTLNLWPIGGFVKIFGEDPDEGVRDDPDKDRALSNKPRRIQAAVLVGGVLFNVLAAWLLLSGSFAIGIPASANEESVRPVQDPVLTIVGVIPDSPVAQAGLQSGDKLDSLISEGEILLAPSAADVMWFVDVHRQDPITVRYKRGALDSETTAVPVQGLIEEDPERYALGMSMDVIGTLTLPIHLAVWEGLRLTLSMLAAVTVGILGFLWGALTLSADLSQVAGPVGIVGFVGDAAALGLVPLLTFTAFISLNLAVINLLPIPALDGGRLLFVAVEAVKGTPIKPIVARVLNTLGFVFLILLMLAITYNDIIRIFSG